MERMKLTREQIMGMMKNTKRNRLREKLDQNMLTLQDCGLEKEKNFLLSVKDKFLNDKQSLYKYASYLCDSSVVYPSAVFVIHRDMNLEFAIRFNEKDSDYFYLDENWLCSNFISMVDAFNLSAYGVIYEKEPNIWCALTE